MDSGAKKRATLAVQQRRAALSGLFLRHGRAWNQEKYAKELGVSRATIATDLMALESDWRAEKVDNIDAHKQRLLREIQIVKDNAWMGWERSLTDAERETVKTTDEGEERTRMVEGQAGDPKFLAIIRDCQAQERALLGLDAPKREEISGEVRLSASEIADARREVARLFSRPLASLPTPSPAPENGNGNGHNGNGGNGHHNGNGHH